MLQVAKKYENLVEKLSCIFEKPMMIFFTVTLYKIFLDVIYYFIIGNKNSFFYIKISPINTINGWLLVLIMAWFLKTYYEQKTPSAIIMVVFNMIYFIPITTYCSLAGGSSSFLFFAAVYWLILSLLQVKVPMFYLKKSKSKASGKGIYILTIIISVILLYIWGKYAGFRILTSLIDVYDVRAEASKYAIPVGLSYIVSVAHIIVSLIILHALINKKYILLVWSFFLTLINFSYAGHKAIILFPIILVGGYFFYRKNMIKLLFPAGIILEILAIIEYKMGSIYISSLLFRRNGFVLAQLSENYYRFFNENSIDFFRNSIMGKLGFESIWNLPMAKVIGNNFETQIINCNNGLLADVWANLGIIGIAVMPIILIMCLRFLDFATEGVDIRVTVGLTLYYAVAFVNSTWSTILLTHGFLIACVILFLFPRNERGKLCAK